MFLVLAEYRVTGRLRAQWWGSAPPDPPLLTVTGEHT